MNEDNPLVSFTVPPLLQQVSKDTTTTAALFGLAGVGPLPEIHHVATTAVGDNDDDDDKSDSLTAAFWNDFPNQRDRFQQWVQHPENATGTVFASKISNAWPLLAGLWHAAPLQSSSSDDDAAVMCGAVFWHGATIGNSINDACQVVQHDICVQGMVSAYNINQETDEFLQLGGRIVGRYTWEASHRHDDYKRAADNVKFNLDAYHQTRAWSPDFCVVPDLMQYSSNIWPTLRDKGPPYGDVVVGNQDEAPTQRPWGKFITTFLSSSSNNDIDNAPKNTTVGMIRASLFRQEYLFGRVLTQQVAHPDINNNNENRTVAKLILVYTYSCPQQLDDALVGNLPIAGTTLWHSLDSVYDFLLDATTTDAQVKDAVNAVSFGKLMETMIRAFAHNQANLSQPDQVQVIRRLILAIYRDRTAAFPSRDPRIPLSENQYTWLFNEVLAYAKEPLLDVFLESLETAGVLGTFLTEVEHAHRDSRDKHWPLPPSVLFVRASNIDRLLQANVQPKYESVVQAMETKSIAELERLVTTLLASSSSSSSQPDTVLRNLAWDATRQLLHEPLAYLLNHHMEASTKEASTKEAFFASHEASLRVPDPHMARPRYAPPTAMGPVEQAAMGRFLVEYTRYLCNVEFYKASLQPARPGTTAPMAMEKPEPYNNDNFVQVLKVLETHRPQASHNDEPWQPTEALLAEVGYTVATFGCRNRDALLVQAKQAMANLVAKTVRDEL